MLITVQNQGQALIGSNFWDSEHARNGLYYLSSNAGAFRLLVPALHKSAVAEFKSARDVILSRGIWVEKGRREALEILFDDETDTPFSLCLDARMLDRLPDANDENKEFVFMAYLPLANGTPWLAYQHKCYYRRVARLPSLRPR